MTLYNIENYFFVEKKGFYPNLMILQGKFGFFYADFIKLQIWHTLENLLYCKICIKNPNLTCEIIKLGKIWVGMGMMFRLVPFLCKYRCVLIIVDTRTPSYISHEIEYESGLKINPPGCRNKTFGQIRSNGHVSMIWPLLADDRPNSISDLQHRRGL